LLAARAGVFVEPASAASVAGVLTLGRRGYFRKGGTVVCVLTGHGLKDPDTAMQMPHSMTEVPATLDAVVSAMASFY